MRQHHLFETASRWSLFHFIQCGMVSMVFETPTSHLQFKCFSHYNMKWQHRTCLRATIIKLRSAALHSLWCLYQLISFPSIDAVHFFETDYFVQCTPLKWISSSSCPWQCSPTSMTGSTSLRSGGLGREKNSLEFRIIDLNSHTSDLIFTEKDHS